MTSNTGQKIIHDGKVRDFIISKVPQKDQPDFTKWACYLSLILKVVSHKGKVDVEQHRDVCLELYRHINSFPWVSIIPSVHRLIGHSW